MANQSSFAARSYRDDAVVLRTHKLGEADRIITLLTKHHGQVRAVAKGVRRTSSRFGARLEPFMVADLQLVSGRTLDIVTQATVVLLAALLTGDWAVADESDLRHRREAAGLVASYLQWHLERAVKSLKHVERS